MPEDEYPTALSRRQFLRGAGAVGAAAALVPNLLDHADAAPPDDSQAVAQRGNINLTLTINGQKRLVRVEPRTTLLNALRNHLDPPLTGTKIVCDRGSCGACTVQMDGKTVYSCMTLAADAVGKRVTTIEGLSQDEDHLSPVQDAFVKHDALMCGFCTPGFVMSVTDCLEKNPRADLAQIKNACAGNTCRCGTYPKIFEAALAAGPRMGGGKKEG